MHTQKIALSRNPLLRYLPALLIMLAIFLFSAGPSIQSPDRLLRLIVNKGGHMVGYGLLALALWRAFEFRREQIWIAWLLTVLYALSDEFHQSFVPGRFPSLVDVFVYDNLGALAALWLLYHYFRKSPALYMDPREDGGVPGAPL